MEIKLPKDQGRSPIDQLQADYRDKFAQGQKSVFLPPTATTAKDTFEPSSSKKANKASEQTEVKDDTTASSAKADGLNISFQFDLFYELSSKVEAKMGQSGANRFTELSGKVSETFMGSFNLSIDAVGSFMNGTDKSLDISNETTNKFFDAVEGLADLSPEALQDFLKESDTFFNELENTYGEANGAFDQIKSQMQDQATAFFADVEQARNDALTGGQQQLPESTEDADNSTAGTTTDLSSPASSGAADQENSLIEMLFKPGLKISQDDYKSFLSDFAEYAQKFRQQMFEKLLGNRSGYDKTGKTGEESDDKKTSLIDTAV